MVPVHSTLLLRFACRSNSTESKTKKKKFHYTLTLVVVCNFTFSYRSSLLICVCFALINVSVWHTSTSSFCSISLCRSEKLLFFFPLSFEIIKQIESIYASEASFGYVDAAQFLWQKESSFRYLILDNAGAASSRSLCQFFSHIHSCILNFWTIAAARHRNGSENSLKNEFRACFVLVCVCALCI